MNVKMLIVLILSTSTLIAQDFKELDLNAEITKATVFLEGAQVTREGKLEIEAGKSVLTLKSLSPYMDNKSIKVNAEGDFTVLSVRHLYDYLDERKKSAKVDSLLVLVEEIDDESNGIQARLEVLEEKKGVLDANKKLGQELGLDALQKAIAFYDEQLTAILKEDLSISKDLRALHLQRAKIQAQIKAVYKQRTLPSSSIEIRVETDEATDASFEVSYLVSNAGWYPNYDVRVEGVNQPIILDYKADVYQNTGVDWENVKLKFSNANPNESGIAPELVAWYLNFNQLNLKNFAGNNRNYYYGLRKDNINSVSGKIVDNETGEALPGASIRVEGSTIGTVTDVDGNFNLNLPPNSNKLVVSYVGYHLQTRQVTTPNITIKLMPALETLDMFISSEKEIRSRVQKQNLMATPQLFKQELNSANADIINTATIENQTTVEFEVEAPYTIRSNSAKMTINLNAYKIDALYAYYAVPKLDKDAFLLARIIDWDQYNLLEGEVNLFFEDAFVGRSILDAKSLTDTLDISLGRDKGIAISRKKIDAFSKKKFAGSNKIESRAFKITVRNNKSKKLRINLLDQIPIASNSDITVTAKGLSGGNLEAKTGQITWTIELDPNEQKELEFSYEVKYPKKEKIILE